MDLTQVDSPRGAKRRRLSRGVVLAVAVATCAVLLTPSVASAHIKDERLRLRYLNGVAAWEGTMDSYLSGCIAFQDHLGNLLTEMERLYPPKDANETEGLQALADSALSLYLLQLQWHLGIESKDPGAIKNWARKVRPCFTTAADKRLLHKAADRLIEGLMDLLDFHSGFLEAAQLASAKKVGEARGRWAQALVFNPTKKIDAAIRALKRLAN